MLFIHLTKRIVFPDATLAQILPADKIRPKKSGPLSPP